MLTEFLAALWPELREHIDKFAAKSLRYHLEPALFKLIFRIQSSMEAMQIPLILFPAFSLPTSSPCLNSYKATPLMIIFCGFNSL